MAAPHVSGVAALILAKEPTLTAAQVRARLVDYAIDLGSSGRDDEFGAGLVNARNSLTRTHAPQRALCVQLRDALTGAIIKTVASASGAYEFRELPDGEYYVFAGLDEEGDQTIGSPERIWGAYASGGKAAILKVNRAGIYPASFSAGFPLEAEPNNSKAEANGVVVGGYVHGTFSTASDVDVYEVTLPAGQYTFETSGWLETACGFTNAASTYLGLHTAGGIAIASNQDIDADRYNYCSRITQRLEAGTYYLHIRPTSMLFPNPDGSVYRMEVRSGS
jgi:hypothetical protein